MYQEYKVMASVGITTKDARRLAGQPRGKEEQGVADGSVISSSPPTVFAFPLLVV